MPGSQQGNFLWQQVVRSFKGHSPTDVQDGGALLYRTARAVEVGPMTVVVVCRKCAHMVSGSSTQLRLATQDCTTVLDIMKSYEGGHDGHIQTSPRLTV